ncbi:MAG: hypothetical protein H0V62_03370 [Gammaproteobacteria bacterium]|nr:hypothetical protein [Gammaproteobacteria bacterium]
MHLLRTQPSTRRGHLHHRLLSSRWGFWIDRGGTFTDVVGERPEDRLVSCKLLAGNSDQYTDAAAVMAAALIGNRARGAASYRCWTY